MKSLKYLLARTKPQGDCLVWTKGTSNGYPMIWSQGKARAAHRYMWELHHGPVPAGLYICHTCDNPKCLNINHLYAGTPSQNVQDCLARKRHSSQRKTNG